MKIWLLTYISFLGTREFLNQNLVLIWQYMTSVRLVKAMAITASINVQELTWLSIDAYICRLIAPLAMGR